LDVVTGSTWIDTLSLIINGTPMASTTALTTGTNYLDIILDDDSEFEANGQPAGPGFNIFYECISSSDGTLATMTTFWSPLTDAAGNADVYDFVVPVASSDTEWNNPNMTTLPNDNFFDFQPYVNSAFQSLFPYLPLCNGSGEGFPSPKVVVSQLTATVGQVPRSTATALPANGM
jgi:hypothetical protein